MPQRSQARALIYTRQSTHREESISLELQDAACRDYCKTRGYRALEAVSDPGVSGLQFEKRPGIRRVIDMAEAGQVDVVVIYRWSRLSRRQMHQAVILDRLEKAGVRVEAASEPVDSTTASGKFGRNVLLAAADFESAQKSEQWREAQERRRQRGLPAGGAPPFGYMEAAERGKPFEIHPDQGPLLARMYADYLKGHGPQRIAMELNSAGHRSARGKEFSVATVTRILDSGFGAGYLRFGVNVRDSDGKKRDVEPRFERGAHEPVIDEATWKAYQRERESRRRVHPKSRQPKWFLGGGLTVCGKCGGNLIVNSYKEKSQAICGRYRNRRTCDGIWLNRTVLESIVGLWLGGRINQWADAADEIQGTDQERAALSEQMSDVRGEIVRLNEGRTALLKQLARGVISEAEAEAALAEAAETRAEVDDRIGRLTQKLDALSPDADVWERIGRGADGQTPDEWSALLRKIIEKVSVDTETVTITPWRGEPAVYERKAFMPKPASRSQARTADGRFLTSRSA